MEFLFIYYLIKLTHVHMVIIWIFLLKKTSIFLIYIFFALWCHDSMFCFKIFKSFKILRTIYINAYKSINNAYNHNPLIYESLQNTSREF